MKPPTGQASGSASSASQRRLFLEPPPPPVNSSTLPATLTPGSQKSRSSSGSPSHDLGLCLSVASASATPSSSPSPATTTDDVASLPSQDGSGAVGGGGSKAAGVGGSGAAAGGSGAAAACAGGSCASGANDSGAAGGTQVQGQQGQGTNTTNAILIEGDEPVLAVQDGDDPCGKRAKRCTSNVWQYFSKKRIIIEDNGKTYLQVWAHCNQPGCKHKARAEGDNRFLDPPKNST